MYHSASSPRMSSPCKIAAAINALMDELEENECRYSLTRIIES